MKNHIKQPCICPECEIALQDLIEKQSQAGASMYCDHNEVFVWAGADKGIITNWTIEGPITMERGQQLIEITAGVVKKVLMNEKKRSKLN